MAENKEQKDQPAKKNWDQIVKEFEEDEEKNGEKDANDVFRKIYADADDDMKRAMIKSMQESGGTCLSTDWKSVSQKKCEIDPPSGMEYKKWN
ncbi:SGS domain-containing protein-like protein [Leptotrombidium deliense]|uniref:SGS domain-containing protein-like protein n=1 Tax=Leptotrombidium deliense TaxID=299467 RepID=A0A443S572_9ACAR|nr:SGS domain-containing protein-like protein [Leptotrombidium deliense]